MKISQLVLSVVVLAGSTTMASPITLQQPTATFSQNNAGLHVSNSIDGITGPVGTLNGWAINNHEGVAQTAVYETASDLGGPAGASFTFSLIFNFQDTYDIGKFRLSVTTAARTAFADGNEGIGGVSPGDVGASGIWTQLTPSSASASGGGPTLTINGDNSILATGSFPVTTYTVTATTTLNGITGIRLETLPDSSFPGNGPGAGPSGNFVLTEFQVDEVNLPEPASAALLFGGALSLLMRRRLFGGAVCRNE